MNWDMVAAVLSAISIMVAVYTYVDGVALSNSLECRHTGRNLCLF